MRKPLWIIGAAALLCLPGLAPAGILRISPDPPDLGGLDHSTLQTWRIDAQGLAYNTITSATLTIKDIYNWADEPNRLFIHLLDSAQHAGVAVGPDREEGIVDYYLNPDPSLGPPYGPANILLDAPSFAGGYENRVDYVYRFTPEQLAILQAFIDNDGQFAFGFDPDCHYSNGGITFEAATAPEPASMLLVGTCLLAAAMALRRRRPPRQ
ncbi:MAG: PEP-CTERM sorting domain-containing protein [Bryobacterales bacterium]|nr:PEP-CTERM sorting domain-containing protein [Bryobacterales bacterium]